MYHLPSIIISRHSRSLGLYVLKYTLREAFHAYARIPSINSLLYESLLYEGRFFMPLLSLGMSRWFGLPLISLPPLPSQCPVQLQSTPECLVENMANFAMFLR